MYFPIFIIFLLAISTNAEGPSEDRIAKIEEKMAEILKLLTTKMANNVSSPTQGTKLNDTNLEERVLALEFQMANVQEDITNISDDVDVLTSEVTIIHADQVVQDERILDVEDEVELVGRGVVALEENVNGLDASNTQLNVSVSQLDVRVTTLESQNGTSDNVTDELNELNQRVDVLEEDVTDLQITVSNLDETVTVLEETTEGLNVAVGDLDSRVSDLEESGGNGTNLPAIAFHAYDRISPITSGSVVVFPDVDLNLGEAYNSETGEFTVPAGGAGVYYLYFHTVVGVGKYAQLHIRRNNVALCYAWGDHDPLGVDEPPASCGVVAELSEGDVIHVFYNRGTDDTPIVSSLYTAFTGFRIDAQ